MNGTYTTQELFQLAEEYRKAHPEQDHTAGWVVGASNSETYYLGAVDFLQWLANGKQFLYEPETYEDLDDETFRFLADIRLTSLDQEEEENIQRDETY